MTYAHTWLPLKDPPVPLGTVIKPWGKVSAVGMYGGERYYWFVDKDGDVAMMPASVVEQPDNG